MMEFQLFAIWVMVIAAIVWFVRDERLRRHQELDRAARLYALAPEYRHVVPNALEPAAGTQGGVAAIGD